MTEAYASMSGSAKPGGAETCTVFPESCTVSPLQAALTDLIRAFNPQKTWTFVADLFGLRERSAKHRLSNSVNYTIEELQLLIQGEDGLAYLEALMAEAQPRWWLDLRKTIELSRIRGEQALLQQRAMALDNTPMARQDRRKMKRVIDADRNLSAARAEQETAVGILLQNSNGPVVGAMAPAAVKGKIQAAGMQRAGGRGR
ncbi:hypothetical protein [Tardiphaga sp.]|uniref:hypothetical protein n=1 Tax=Tardiphaga sp. TaxID=1926292 RepID=UPI0037DA0ADE